MVFSSFSIVKISFWIILIDFDSSITALICIDQAQRIPNIVITLKRFIDMIKDVQVIASGSSAFDLANQTAESLTGRKYEFLLLPLSSDEMINRLGFLEETRLLKHRLIFGYEFKWNPVSRKKIPQTFIKSYSVQKSATITPDNFAQFLSATD